MSRRKMLKKALRDSHWTLAKGREPEKLRPRTPVQFKRSNGRGLPRWRPTRAMTNHQPPDPWRLRQQPTWLKSSKLSAEAATAADFEWLHPLVGCHRNPGV